MSAEVKAFFDQDTWTLTYVVYDQTSADAIVIDPVHNYEPGGSRLSRESVDQVLSFIQSHKLNVHFILETHAHADHLSGSQILKESLPMAKVGIGAQITEVQKLFKNVFNLSPEFKVDGSQFDFLIEEGQTIKAGSLNIETIYTPGHTPACASYLIGDLLFTGDALFMPDFGTGRCDFPAGSAKTLYHSVHEKIYKLPDSTKIFVGHDYMPHGRELKFISTVGEQKQSNIQLKESTSEAEFVQFRTERDKQLMAPRLLLQSVQVNIDAGRLPKAESNGACYLKIPIR